MRLETTIQVYAGGPGSGPNAPCDNCGPKGGRPPVGSTSLRSLGVRVWKGSVEQPDQDWRSTLEYVDPKSLYYPQEFVQDARVEYYKDARNRNRGQLSIGETSGGLPQVFEQRDGRLYLADGAHRGAAALMKGRVLKIELFHNPERSK